MERLFEQRINIKFLVTMKKITVMFTKFYKFMERESSV